MEKTIFLAIFDKIFFSSLRKLRSSKNFFVKLPKKMDFFIFKVNLDFNDLIKNLKIYLKLLWWLRFYIAVFRVI